MSAGTDFLLILVVLTNLALAGSSRLTALIRVAAAQGVLLGLFPILARGGAWTPRILLLALVAGGLKGVVFPVLLGRALREANIRRDVEPFVGYNASILAGVLGLAASVWIASRLPLPSHLLSRLALSVAFATILNGMFLIAARKKAITQVVGYLVLENGIFLFSVSAGAELPFAVELGVLLDVFVAVFVMGIAVFHISREFDHVEVDRLSTLRDWRP